MATTSLSIVKPEITYLAYLSPDIVKLWSLRLHNISNSKGGTFPGSLILVIMIIKDIVTIKPPPELPQSLLGWAAATSKAAFLCPECDCDSSVPSVPFEDRPSSPGPEENKGHVFYCSPRPPQPWLYEPLLVYLLIISLCTMGCKLCECIHSYSLIS